MAKRSFNIGEKVSSINDLVRGRVVRISGDKVVIHCEEGFEQEFDSSELIKISNWDHWIGDPATEESEGDQKSRSRVREPAEESVKEVDLHLHEITEFESGMSNHEKLQLQLDVAKRELQKAMERKRKKIVFIHGRGQGVLKQELHRLLRNYPVDFNDASYLEYGQGATEVRIFQNRK